MSKKKIYSLLLLIVIGVFAFMSVGFAQAVEKPTPPNQPPLCYPIESFVPGYWGMECIDKNHNIDSAVLDTNSPHTLEWDKSYARMWVELEVDTKIFWQVCDSFGACRSGGYP